MKSVVRVIYEILEQGDISLFKDNIDMFVDMEKNHLELAYMSGSLQKEAQSKDFLDYYCETYLKEFVDAFKSAMNEKDSDEVPRKTIT